MLLHYCQSLNLYALLRYKKRITFLAFVQFQLPTTIPQARFQLWQNRIASTVSFGSQGPSMNHFGTYLRTYLSTYLRTYLLTYVRTIHLWGKSSYTQTYYTKNVRNYTSQCSKFFLFCRNPKNDQVRAKKPILGPKNQN